MGPRHLDHHTLSRSHEYLLVTAVIGTSDQPCWLAEACERLAFFFSHQVLSRADLRASQSVLQSEMLDMRS